MVAEGESFLEQRVPGGGVGEREEEGALGGDVPARAPRRPARLAVPARHRAARQLPTSHMAHALLHSTPKRRLMAPYFSN